MELFLRPLNDPNGVTWSIIWSLVILLAGVIYVIAYILRIDEMEAQEHGSHDTTEQEELLQLPSDRDQQSSGRGHD